MTSTSSLSPNASRPRGGIRIHRGDLLAQDVTIVQELPATTVERTIADLPRAGHDPNTWRRSSERACGEVSSTSPTCHPTSPPLARRHHQPDGSALLEYLLDIVGLSQAALTRELAQSPAGQGLLAAGRLSAIGGAARVDQPADQRVAAVRAGQFDFGKNADLSQTFALQRSMAAVQPAPDNRTRR